MSKGYLNIFLHAHLPYVRHPEYDRFFEENWLFEAITESYIPLLSVCERLLDDGIDFKLTLSLSPTLITMLGDDFLKDRYISYLDRLVELSEKEIERTACSDPLYHNLAKRYNASFLETRHIYADVLGTDLLGAFRRFSDAGVIELVTTAATHGFLPLLCNQESSVRSQIFAGVRVFENVFGKAPKGFWLPECGYYPGLENILKEAGVEYFMIDTHGLLNADSESSTNVYVPLVCQNGVVAYGRDPETSHCVWSAREGYPGDFEYREYHSDIGYELDMDYIGPYILDGEKRIATGIKYHRISGPNMEKELYDPERATKKAIWHASDFIKRCQQRISISESEKVPPVITAPYDAELFGHWWFEGPQWLEAVIRGISKTDSIELSTGSHYMQDGKENFVTGNPSASSWGELGYNRYWLNEKTDWIYPKLHHVAKDMEFLVKEYGDDESGLVQRALKQAARSLLLAQASDWPFILKTDTATEYANGRIEDYIARFSFLYDAIVKNNIDEKKLCALETTDKIFPDIDFCWYMNNNMI